MTIFTIGKQGDFMGDSPNFHQPGVTINPGLPLDGIGWEPVWDPKLGIMILLGSPNRMGFFHERKRLCSLVEKMASNIRENRKKARFKIYSSFQ